MSAAVDGTSSPVGSDTRGIDAVGAEMVAAEVIAGDTAGVDAVGAMPVAAAPVTAERVAAEPIAAETPRPTVRDIAFGYSELSASPEEGIWIATGGRHRVRATPDLAMRLRAALVTMTVAPDATLLLLGADVGKLDAAARTAIASRVGYIPADGGLLSHLSGWENMTLPLGYHRPDQLRNARDRVDDLLRQLGTEPGAVLDRRPEGMVAAERRAIAAVRVFLLEPELVMSDLFLNANETPSERDRVASLIATAYSQVRRGGTLIEIHDARAG